MWYIYMIDYCTATMKNKPLTHKTIYMNLETHSVIIEGYKEYILCILNIC